MNENLPELRDIHLPEGVSVWPPAYGWWVILGEALCFVLIIALVQLLRKKSKKLYALHLLKNIYCNNSLRSVVEMSALLRRICVFKYKEAMTLYGEDWLNFLNSHSSKKLEGESAQLLLDAPYMKNLPQDFKSGNVVRLRLFCQNWIGENL